MPTREARDNTTRVLDLLHLAWLRAVPTLLLSADAEQAFNPCLNLGVNMCRWIDALYSHSSAAVKVNAGLSLYFFLVMPQGRGVLFCHSFLPLPWIPYRDFKENTDIKGLEVGKDSHKVVAYVDDLMFIMHLSQTTRLMQGSLK